MLTGCIGTDTLCAFLEGRADPGTRASVEQHASRCSSCRELLSSLARSGTPPPIDASGAPAEPSLPAGAQVGRYVIEREIGAGGMGMVYAAHDPALGRMVAVKVLRGGDRSLQERIRREAQAMARLTHPNVVAVYDVGQLDDRIFIAMEYVPGQTLGRWAASRSQREILDAFCAAGRGLAAAHAAGIVHRDFKPDNILVGQDGRVRVGDFGLARTAIGTIHVVPPSGVAALPSAPDEPSKPPRLTAPGTLLGTPYYIAPELYDGADADARSDQFSFCVALFTTLHGEKPFEGDTFATLATNVRKGRLQKPRGASRVPRRIRAAIRRGLSADPAVRFASLRELLVELDPSQYRARPSAAVWGLAAAGLAGGAVAVALRLTSPAGDQAERSPSAAARSAVPARLGELQRRLGDARAEVGRGSYHRARALFGPILSDAHALGDLAFESEVHFHAAVLEHVLGSGGEAERLLLQSIWSAEAGRNDEIAARAWSALVLVVGVDKAEHARAMTLEPRATAAIARLGGHPGIEASLERALGAVALELRELGMAEKHVERAVELEKRASGEASAAMADAQGQLAEVALAQGQPDRARLLAQRALEIAERALGPEHPEVAPPLHALGNAQLALGLHPEGEQTLRRALAPRERALGRSHPAVSATLRDLARAVRMQGKGTDAVELAGQAVAAAEASAGPDHPLVADALVELGASMGRLGRHAQAGEPLRRAEVILGKALGTEHVRTMLAVAARADELLQQSRWREAGALYERALAVLERSQASGDARASAQANLCRVQVELDQPARALESLEQLASKLVELPPAVRVTVEFALARALWATGGDRARARELATQAMSEIRTISAASPVEVVQLERWLMSHRGR